MDESPQVFGCPAFWPPDADAAWSSFNSLSIDHEFVDESHFMVKLRSCRKCSQQFVSAFSETVDWSDGDDPQFWSSVPVTPAESKVLLEAGESAVEKACATTAARRSLCHDHPKGPARKTYWSKGLVIVAHD